MLPPLGNSIKLSWSSGRPFALLTVSSHALTHPAPRILILVCADLVSFHIVSSPLVAYSVEFVDCCQTHCSLTVAGSGVDTRDPLRDLYRSVQIGRDAHRAHSNGDLDELLDREVHGFQSCPVCKQGAVAMLAGLRAAGYLEII